MSGAERVITEHIERGRVCVTSSFQSECVVLLHLLKGQRPSIPVLFLDTHHHFPEVLAYRDAIVEQWQLCLTVLKAASPEVGRWQTDTTACCRQHKVDPLFSALDDYDVWFTALRRDQSPSRAALQEVEPFHLPSGRVVQRVSPLASWTAEDVRAFAAAHDIPLLPLYDAGYTSIGCEPCTSRPLDPRNPRSGRWAGEKLECGIHVQATKPAGKAG